MRTGIVAAWAARLTLMKISTIGIVVTSLLSASIALVTFYGDKAGNYVIGVNTESTYALTLYDTEDYNVDLDEGTATLTAPGIRNLTNETYSSIQDLDSKALTAGSHNTYTTNNNEGLFFIYTFYLVNKSSGPVPVSTEIELSGNFLPVHEAVRVMLIFDGVSDSTYHKETIYSYANAEGNPDDTYLKNGQTVSMDYTTQAWASEKIVCQDQIEMAYKGEIKVTLIMWIEGNDMQCTDDIKGGTLRFGLNFSVVRESTEG